MSASIIGVTSSLLKTTYGYMHAVGRAYTDSLIKFGACPVIIPNGLPESDLREVLRKLDGVLFTGGGDVRPERYNSREHPLVDEVNDERDMTEIQLLNDAVKSGIPFMGICRGLQLVNVALGGTLYEDILDQRPESLRHSNFPEHTRDYLAHGVRIESDSRLAIILREQNRKVNSMHHQGINRLAPSLRATAFADDGVIEAVELGNHPFGLAVQWHPECLPNDPAMMALFQAFILAAGQKH